MTSQHNVCTLCNFKVDANGPLLFLPKSLQKAFRYVKGFSSLLPSTPFFNLHWIRFNHLDLENEVEGDVQVASASFSPSEGR